MSSSTKPVTTSVEFEFQPPPANYRELYPVHVRYAKPKGNPNQGTVSGVIVNQPKSSSSGPLAASIEDGKNGLRKGLVGFESLIPVQSLKLTFSEINDCCPGISVKNVTGELLYRGNFGTNLCCVCCQCRESVKEIFLTGLDEERLVRVLFQVEQCLCADETDFYEIFAPMDQRLGSVTYRSSQGEQSFVIKNEISAMEYTVRRGIGENAHIKTLRGDVIAVVDINRPGKNIRPSYTMTFTQQEITLIDKILLIGFLISLDVLYLESTFVFQCIFIPCFSIAFGILLFLILYYKLIVSPIK